MGASRDNFMKCPRTPYLHDAKGTDSDKYLVRPEFVENVKQSEHWQHQAMVVNGLTNGANIWS